MPRANGRRPHLLAKAGNLNLKGVAGLVGLERRAATQWAVAFGGLAGGGGGCGSVAVTGGGGGGGQLGLERHNGRLALAGQGLGGGAGLVRAAALALPAVDGGARLGHGQLARPQLHAVPRENGKDRKGRDHRRTRARG